MNKYHVVCERTLSGCSTPDVILEEASLNKVLDILLDSWFMAVLVRAEEDVIEFQAYCLNAVDTFYVSKGDLPLLWDVYQMCVEVEGERTPLLQSVLDKYYNLEKSTEVTKSLTKQSHKTLISILCRILEDGVSLVECLELANLRPVYELYSGRIVGLV